MKRKPVSAEQAERDAWFKTARRINQAVRQRERERQRVARQVAARPSRMRCRGCRSVCEVPREAANAVLVRCSTCGHERTAAQWRTYERAGFYDYDPSRHLPLT